MSTFPVQFRRGLSLLLGVVATTIAYNQQASAADPSVYRMVFMEGGNRHVHYVASGNLSTSDSSTLSDLERAENELSYVNDLQQLKYQYVRDERNLQSRRRAVQERLYGRRISYGGYNSTYANYLPNSGLGVPGSYGYNTFYGPFGRGGYGGGYGGAAIASRSGSAYSETQSLQFGMGDEGRVKNAIVQVIAQQASADYAATVRKNYEDALKRAADSPILSRDLGLKKSKEAPPARNPARP